MFGLVPLKTGARGTKLPSTCIEIPNFLPYAQAAKAERRRKKRLENSMFVVVGVSC